MITNFKLNAESVFEQVSAVCGVSVVRMQTKGRQRELVRAKRMFCAILRENTMLTFSEIGRHINIEYAEKYKEVDDILNERVSITNNHYIFTYKIEEEDNRSILLPGRLKGYVRIFKQSPGEMVFECVASSFIHAINTMSIREIFVDRELIKVEKV